MRNFIRLLALSAAIALISQPAFSADIVREWTKASPPDAPSIQKVSVSDKDTALLVLDIEELTCNEERRPRCVESVPKIADLLSRARQSGVTVAHSQTPRKTPFLSAVTPVEGEHKVAASVNKFYGTDLYDYLAENGIKRVIIVGTAAHGAVLHTATAASSQHGFEVIIPVDGLSASTRYIEQATVINLLTGPGTRRNIVLTRTDMIDF